MNDQMRRLYWKLRVHKDASHLCTHKVAEHKTLSFYIVFSYSTARFKHINVFTWYHIYITAVTGKSMFQNVSIPTDRLHIKCLPIKVNWSHTPVVSVLLKFYYPSYEVLIWPNISLILPFLASLFDILYDCITYSINLCYNIIYALKDNSFFGVWICNLNAVFPFSKCDMEHKKSIPRHGNKVHIRTVMKP